jgi:23S rRNA pseudouridine1911/1915/1917 synthase
MGGDKDLMIFSPAPGPGAQRLDAFLGGELAGRLSREKVKKAILLGRVSLNGAVCRLPRRKVRAGDRLELDLGGGFALELAGSDAPPAPERKELNILYQDADLAVLNKPAGLTVHPCPSCPSGTLVNRLLAHFPELALTRPHSPAHEFGQPVSRPGIVHRLDKDTTGLMLVALHEEARLALAGAFAGREVYKEYLALAHGVPAAAAGRIDAPLGRHPKQKTKMAVLEKGGREALSDYRALYADPAGKFSLLAVRIHTGRTHQVRVHLHRLGHPIIGDSTYFDVGAARALLPACATQEEARGFMRGLAQRPLLHAWKISFRHPGSGAAMSFTCPPPPDFYRAARLLSRATRRLALTGNVGCGKSSVLELLRKKGIPAWSADQAVAESYQAGGDGWRVLHAAFCGRFTPDPERGVDKKALFQAMYDDAAMRREVERMVHPIVHQSREDFFRAHDFWRRAGCDGKLEEPAEAEFSDMPDMVVAEIPLFFESARPAAHSGGPASPLLVLGVHCPFSVRAGRLRQYRGWTDDIIAKMESWQWEENRKMRACDLVLDNSGPLEKLEPGLDAVLAEVAGLERRRLDAIETELRALAEDLP